MTGSNTGYYNMLFVRALPLMLLLMVSQAHRVVEATAPSGGMPTVIKRMTTLVAFVLVLTQIQQVSRTRMNVLHVLKAGAERDLLPEAIERPLQNRLAAFRFPANPQTYRVNGLLADDVRRRLGLDRLTLAAPDIGGLGLCCAPGALRVVDIALLANQDLARNGYGALPGLLRRENPELILVHAMWAEAADIYDLNEFHGRYRAVVIADTLFWLRADLLGALAAAPGTRLVALDGKVALTDLRNDLRSNDLAYLRTGAPQPILLLQTADAAES